MSKLNITNPAGKDAGTMDVSDGIFAVEPNVPVMHEVVRAQMAALRQGTHNTKTRGLVSGGGRKPFNQKGTGRARQGTTRAPQMAGGGVVFGPHTRSHAVKTNKKVIKLAMRSALSAKCADGELTVVDAFSFEKPSTKQAAEALKALGVSGRVTLVIADDDVNTYLSFRNIPKVRVIAASESNTYDLVDNGTLVMTKEAVEYIEEVLA